MNQDFTLLDEIPQVFWTANPQGEIDYINHRAREYFAAPDEELLGTGWIQRLHPEDADRALATWSRCLRDSIPCSVEYRMRLGNDGYRWILAQARPILDANGKALKWVGTCSDIHALKEYEARLEEQSFLLKNAQDAIYSCTPEGVISYWNKGAERIFGWTATEMVGKRAADLLFKSADEERAARERVLREGTSNKEATKLTKDGREVLVKCSCTLIKDERGTPKSILSIESDITEQRRVENHLVRAQRLESLGTLAGGIAHDINNMLSPIIMAAEMLQMQSPREEDVPMLEIVRDCATRAADLVKQILSFAGGMEASFSTVSLGDLLAKLSQMIKDTFPKSIRFELQNPASLPWIKGDATQLSQALLNLCVNARDAMEAGGTLRIAAQVAHLDEHYCAMEGDATPGTYIRIDVADTGTGIPEEVADHIFDPFFTTKGMGKGTGLGLSMSLGIVKSHGGFIRVETERGRGTTFQVFLPVHEEDEQSPAANAPAAPPRGSGQTILIVDDEASVREVSKRILEKHGYKVILAGDGAEAIAVYASGPAKPDVVLSDINMPVMDGMALARALVRIDSQVRIVAVSGAPGQANTSHLAAMGVRRFIAKPYTANVLLRAIADVLQVS